MAHPAENVSKAESKEGLAGEGTQDLAADKRMDGQMNVGMEGGCLWGRTDGRTSRWVDGRMSGRTDEGWRQMGEWVGRWVWDGPMGESLEGWVDGWTGGRMFGWWVDKLPVIRAPCAKFRVGPEAALPPASRRSESRVVRDPSPCPHMPA